MSSKVARHADPINLDQVEPNKAADEEEKTVDEEEDSNKIDAKYDKPKYKRPHCKNFFQWVPTDDDQMAKSEKRMLKSIASMIEQKTVAGLNTIATTNPKHKRHVVLIHGFAGGVGNWLPNWKALAEYTNVYAIDLPGFGRSYRPDVKFGSAVDAIEFMTESILMWLKEMKLTPEANKGVKVDLCGHSFGGYVSANFAIRYPSLIDKLILTDPWGCPKEYDRKLQLKFRIALKIFYFINPLFALRGPWGATILPSVRKDFADRWKQHIDDPNDFYDYTFHCNAASPPIGEQAFQACCTGAVFPKLPLEVIIPEGLDPEIELGVIFGAKTWMPVDAGVRMLDGFKAKGGKCTPNVVSIPDAGHQVMSDNARDYNNALLEMLDYATMM